MKQAIKNFLKYRFLLVELVKKGIKLKYRRSYLGLIWTLLEPLLTMIVLTVVFGTLFNNTDRTFPVYILTGRLLYSFFSSGTNGALKAIQTNASQIKKVYVPKYLYPLANILFNYVIFLLSLIVLVGVSLVLGVKPTLHTLVAVVPLGVILLLTFGVGMILSTIGVFFRDMEYLWSVALMLVMYASAIFYPASRLLNSSYAWILKFNPLYCVIYMLRDAVLNKDTALSMRWCACYSTGFAFVTIIIGLLLFKKKQDNFILHI